MVLPGQKANEPLGIVTGTMKYRVPHPWLNPHPNYIHQSLGRGTRSNHHYDKANWSTRKHRLACQTVWCRLIFGQVQMQYDLFKCVYARTLVAFFEKQMCSSNIKVDVQCTYIIKHMLFDVKLKWLPRLLDNTLVDRQNSFSVVDQVFPNIRAKQNNCMYITIRKKHVFIS